MRSTDGQRFALLLRPLGGEWASVPPATRLARLAKATARSYGFAVEKMKVVKVKRHENPVDLSSGRTYET